MKRGKFIVLQGLDRSGKSTMVRHIQSTLNQIPTTLLNFPDRTTKIGQMLNDFLTSKEQLSNEAVHLLFSANRWQSMNKIQKLLQSGNTIICDRYWYSGVAYSMAKGMNEEWCKYPDKGLIEPDLIIYLKANPDTLSKRNGFGEERFQRLEFQSKVKLAFEKLLEEAASQKIKVVDVGNKSIENVKSEIENIISDSKIFEIDQ